MTMPARVTPLPSRYVQRCDQCRQVRGVSAFRVLRLKHGGRSPTCRWCEDQNERETRVEQRSKAMLDRLLRTRAELVAELARLTRQIRAVEAEVLAHARPSRSRRTA